MTKEALVGRLQEVLAGRPEIRFALLFGSAATRGPDVARDVDIAVSFVGRTALLDECALAAQIEGYIGREVDLVDVDTASTLLRWEVVRTGVPVISTDRDALIAFQARVPIEYFDLRPYLDREAEGLRRVLERTRWSASTW